MTSPVKKSKKKSSNGEGEMDYDRSFPKCVDASNWKGVDMAKMQTATTSNGMVMKGDELAVQSLSAQNQCSPEDRQRINVGWVAGPADAKEEYDHKIAVYSQRLGCQMYNFVSYPIGGVKRGFWKPNSTTAVPPPIDLPDVQLQNHLWETYVNAQISPWIDCDSEKEELAALSEVELQKELNYCAYMGLRSAVFRLKHADSPRLARILNQWLWTKNVNLCLWILVPTSAEDLVRLLSDERDCWAVWADFRKLCSNFSSQKLIAGLHLTADIDYEFVDKKLISRWKAEPLATFCVDVDAFVTCKDSQELCLPPAHANLLVELWMSDNSRIMVRGPRDHEISTQVQLQCAQALRSIVRDVSARSSSTPVSGFLVDSNINYVDVLQVPLQPLADNLDSGVYNTFEQDPVKYRRYREAVELAIHDYGESAARPERLVLYILGAGRGPLVTCSIEAERNYNARFRCKRDRLQFEVYVVEKNANAIVTLKYMNQNVWRRRCVIIEADMRDVPSIAAEHGYPQPDIIVSELLGSFGDNELSPECLDGITPLLKPSTISIPQKYTSFVAPIMSLHMHQQIRLCSASYWNRGLPAHGRIGPQLQLDGSYRQNYPQGEHVANMDQIYVAFLRQYCALADPKPVFTFVHPNFENKSNERSASISFEMDRPADLMGFAGYFHMNLYKDITLSIEPSTFSDGMISWFPALIPLRELYRVLPTEKVALYIERKVDDSGVWYEWFIHHTDTDGELHATAVQNRNGESYYMKLH
uniref:Protein arginine N-methyltransferase n=1 Tax=Haemonchus contortus TaxID=6289 RepID=A0A7I4YC01_HAECO